MIWWVALAAPAVASPDRDRRRCGHAQVQADDAARAAAVGAPVPHPQPLAQQRQGGRARVGRQVDPPGDGEARGVDLGHFVRAGQRRVQAGVVRAQGQLADA
ncbi:hypothetical protein AB0J42_03410 [Nonomuraea sp. NPDC049649]|uniref:hypothetical protein n=1 Tax=Nonomuraea sp. NPDC049649 TaxID=3155776 RepID=UPI003430F51A